LITEQQRSNMTACRRMSRYVAMKAC